MGFVAQRRGLKRLRSKVCKIGHTNPHEASPRRIWDRSVPFRVGWLGFNKGSTLTVNPLLTELQPLRQDHSRAKAGAPLQIVTFSTLHVALNFLPQQHLSPEISSHEYPQELFTLTANRFKLSMLHLLAAKVL